MKKIASLLAASAALALVFTTADAASGLNVGVGFANTNLKAMSVSDETYMGTRYHYSDENTINALSIGPTLKYQASVYDFGNDIGKIDVGLYGGYFFPMTGKKDLGWGDALTLGNQAELGVDLLWNSQVFGLPYYGGVRFGWNSLALSESYTSDVYTSRHIQHASGFSIGPVIGIPITESWTVEVSGSFKNVQFSHDSGTAPDDTWSYTKSAHGPAIVLAVFYKT